MLAGLRTESNPLYQIVVLTTALWLLSFALVPFVNASGLVSEYFMGVFMIWAVLPVAMAFDIGILRQKFAVSARISLPLILVSAVPLVAPVAGLVYVAYRSRVVTPPSGR